MPVAIDLPMSLSEQAAAIVPSEDSSRAPERDSKPEPTIKPPVHESTLVRPVPEPWNLTLDVQPFAERDRVETIWLDGKKQSGNFPLALNAKPGLRKVSWQIGDDIWTDTVTVGSEPVEKNLIFEMSRGRVNVAVTFPDGPGYAEIWLDGRETGQGTPGELRDVAAGPHEVVVKRDGYKTPGGPHIVRVPANDRARISISMTPR